MQFILSIILIFLLFVGWLLYAAFTVEDPALTMHKNGDQDQHDDESNVPSEEILYEEGWEKIEVLYDDCAIGLNSWIYRSVSGDKYRVITEDDYANDLLDDVLVDSYEEAKAVFQEWLDDYTQYNG